MRYFNNLTINYVRYFRVIKAIEITDGDLVKYERKITILADFI